MSQTATLNHLGDYLLSSGFAHAARVLLKGALRLDDADGACHANLAEAERQIWLNREWIKAPHDVTPATILEGFATALRLGLGQSATRAIEVAAGFAGQEWDTAQALDWFSRVAATGAALQSLWIPALLGACLVERWDAAHVALSRLRVEMDMDVRLVALEQLATQGLTDDGLAQLDADSLVLVLTLVREARRADWITQVAAELLRRSPDDADAATEWGTALESALCGGLWAPRLGRLQPHVAGQMLQTYAASRCADGDVEWLRRRLLADLRGGETAKQVLTIAEQAGVDWLTAPDAWLATVGEVLLFRDHQYEAGRRWVCWAAHRVGMRDSRLPLLHGLLTRLSGDPLAATGDLLAARRLAADEQGVGIGANWATRLRTLYFPNSADAASAVNLLRTVLADNGETARAAIQAAIKAGDLPPLTAFEWRVWYGERMFPLPDDPSQLPAFLHRNLKQLDAIAAGGAGDENKVLSVAADPNGRNDRNRVGWSIAARLLEVCATLSRFGECAMTLQEAKLAEIRRALPSVDWASDHTAVYLTELRHHLWPGETTQIPHHLFVALDRAPQLAKLFDQADSETQGFNGWSTKMANRLSRLATAARPLATPTAASPMAELDSVLRPTDAFVDLAVLADQVVALIRRRATGVILRVPLERPLAPVARAAWNALATPPPSDWSLEADLWPLRLLHAALIGPLMEHLHGVSRLIISPHGSLHRVPFATLHDGAAFLGEQFEMIQVPSAAHFVRVRIQPGPYVMDALTLADSGPEWRPAQVAGEALLANFTAARVQRLDASTLSSERAVSFATGAAIVHCSLRGFIDPDFPLCSPLFLGRGVADAKAALCPHHFLAEPAHPVLVVVDGLSSEPGSEASDGEHVNPTLAFLTWGAANVVATAWRAPAAVIGDLFSHFYSAWRTQPVPRALQSAQRLMLENPATSHPHFWGAPICAGEGHTSLAGLRSLGLTPKAE